MLSPLVLCLALLSGTSATAISNYTSQLLSSGTIELGEWQAAYNKAKTLVDSLNTTEKLAIITQSDVARVNWTALNARDSGNAILDYYYATTWPVGHAMAMTWDRDMILAQYNALGSELAAKGYQVGNSPMGEPMGRNPWGGRAAEGYGPDAYLNGISFGLAIKGISSAGVTPNGKHFLLNEQENDRTTVDSSADDKTIHETYLWPFYDAVKNGMGAVMCAMNKVNETFSCENQALLAGLLKTELGFPGYVDSDVGGQKTALNSANAGLDYGSSSYWSTETMTTALSNGSLTTARLNDMVIRNVISAYKLNQLDGSFASLAGTTDYVDPRKNHTKLARQHAAASLAVLKNKNNALPLSSPKSMAIFGAHAGPAMGGPNTVMNVEGSDDVYQGHCAEVGGSGQGSFWYLATPQSALSNRAHEDGTQLRWLLNDTYSSGSTSYAKASFASGTGALISFDGYATNVEVCIAFLNAFSGEGKDRTQLYDADQDAMVNTVASNCNNTIVVINTTGPRLVDQWIEHENVTALVYGSMLGQESGNAIVDVLYGDVNPSGKLIYTIAKNESDYNVKSTDSLTVNFTEGNYIDYKYFDKYNVTPRYEFGFGLSYTTFEYASNVTVTKTNTTAFSSTYATGAVGVGGREDLWDTIATVSTTISNTGSLDGAEVAQLYIQYPASADEPVRQLRGFAKVQIAAGSTGTATFELRRRDLSIWDVAAQNWAIVTGTYELSVGSSSRDLKATTTLTV
ncbi:MAG: hypothetical protein M1834_005413 [Cirrosporium novae-zelandiae]|nr:MAG: hypothetical protein M1834_005413 [Cirrosporium novae-zelandiae]